MIRRLAVFTIGFLSIFLGHLATAKVIDTRDFLSLNNAALDGDFDAITELLKLYQSGFEIKCNGVSGWDPAGTGFADCNEALNQIVLAHNEPSSGSDDGVRGFGNVGDDDRGSGWKPGGTGITTALLTFIFGAVVAWSVHGIFVRRTLKPGTVRVSFVKRGGFSLLGGTALAASAFVLSITISTEPAENLPLALTQLKRDYIALGGEATQVNLGQGVIPPLLK